MFDWILSDTHFNHANIVEFAGRPENHNELIQQNWREVVKADDTVLLLGDVLMGRQELWTEMPGQLPGKVVVVRGNHDHDHKVKFMEETWGWKVIEKLSFQYRGWTIICSHYPVGTEQREGSQDNTDMVVAQPLPPKTLNIHGHIHNRPSPSSQHANVCVENIGYKPLPFEEFLDTKIDALEDL